MKRSIALGITAFAVLATACGQGNVFTLEVGNCFDNPSEVTDEFTDVEIVDCADLHDNEVYYLFDLPDGDFPGEAAIDKAASDGCLAQFDPYVGRAFEESDLGAWPLYPTQGSWDEGDREIVCVLNDYINDGAKLTGSMKGSGV
jgi:hypothetical protein